MHRTNPWTGVHGIWMGRGGVVALQWGPLVLGGWDFQEIRLHVAVVYHSTIPFVVSPQEKCKGAAAQKQFVWLCSYFFLCMRFNVAASLSRCVCTRASIPVKGNSMHSVTFHITSLPAANDIASGNLPTMTCSYCSSLGAFCSFEPLLHCEIWQFLVMWLWALRWRMVSWFCLRYHRIYFFGCPGWYFYMQAMIAMHMWSRKPCFLIGCRHSAKKYGERRASQKETDKNYLGCMATSKEQAQAFSCLDRLRAKWANIERYFWRALDKVEEEV